MRDGMARVFACLSLLFFLVPVTYVRAPGPPTNESQYITLQPVDLDARNSDRNKVGQLAFLGGWKITSDNGAVGGISSMIALPENRFLLLSDNGTLVGFTLDEKRHRAVRPFIAPLPDGPPKPNAFARKNWDSESVVHDSKTGQYWVGFEHQHSIWRYGPSFARKEAAHFLKAARSWPKNGGAEAMLRLSSGRFLVFSESARFAKGGYQALMFDADPAEPTSKTTLFGYQPPEGYKLTDAALLDDRSALMLHRRFTPLDGVSAILSIARLDDFKAGEVASSTAIATLKSPLRVDNMEALAVTREGDEIIVWMASDDNFSVMQETLLFKFRLLKGKGSFKPAHQKRKTEKAGVRPGFSTLEEN